MPIVFEEISGEVVPERGSGESAPPEAAKSTPEMDPAEQLRRELQLHHERQRRLLAD